MLNPPEIGNQVDPVVEKLKIAGKLIKDGKESDRYSKVESAIREASSEIGKYIESKPSSVDKLAYSLRKINIFDKQQGQISRVDYLLEPPKEVRERTGIGMVFIKTSDLRSYQNMDFLDAMILKNPYDDEVDRYTYKFFNASKEVREKMLKYALQVYKDIQEHGIQKNEGEFTIQKRLEGGGENKKVQEFVSTLPFTSKLIESTYEQIQSQTKKTQLDLDKRKENIRWLGPFESTKSNIEKLAGTSDIEGNVALGELFSPPLDFQLLATLEGKDYWSNNKGINGINDYVEAIMKGEKPTTEQKRHAVKKVKDFLTSKLFDFGRSQKHDEYTNDFIGDPSVLWLPNPDGFALQRGFSPVNRTEFGLRSRGGGTLQVGQADERGDVPLRTEGIFTNIHIEPTKPEEKIDEVNEFEMENGNVKKGEDGQPIKKKTNNKGFRPAFRTTITEQTPDGKSETYKLYRVELGKGQNADQGILIQCAGAEVPTLYTRETVVSVVGIRKPVIYLYPPKPTQVTIQLQYKGRLTNTYPHITGDTWKVLALPGGTLQSKGKKYKYLFWDGVSKENDWDWSTGFCVQKDDIDSFLEEKIEQLGLNFAEAQDFITYWAPMMKQNEWSLVSFQTDRYEELAKLKITPAPDALIRVFMVFKKIDGKIDIPEQKLRAVKRNGFTAVEWGGSNFDEIQINDQKEDIILRNTHLRNNPEVYL